MYHLLHRLGFSWITSRSRHPKSNPEAMETFKSLVQAAIPKTTQLKDVDIWFQDESRVGQQNWAKKGTRPRAVKQQQFLYQYIFEDVCPAHKKCAAIVAPIANSESLKEHLNEIAYHVPEGRHGVVVLDQVGWHHKKDLQIPKNLSILYLPPYSPELNSQGGNI